VSTAEPGDARIRGTGGPKHAGVAGCWSSHGFPPLPFGSPHRDSGFVRGGVRRHASGGPTREAPSTVTFEELSPGVWSHLSTFEIEPWGEVPSYGLVVVRDRDALLIDTAWTDAQTEQILRAGESGPIVCPGCLGPLIRFYHQQAP